MNRSNISYPNTRHAVPGGRAVYGVGLQPQDSWDCGFGSRLGHGCLSYLLFMVQEAASARADPSFRGVLPGV